MLGIGSYGQVRFENGKAVKKFKKLSHIIQEYAVGLYLRKEKNIIRIESVDFSKLETTMKFYPYTLSKWINDNKCNFPYDYQDRLKIFKDICIGLISIHGLHLVHADLRPSNILISEIKINEEVKYTAHIGDLGFVSISPFAKSNRTAKPHAEIKTTFGMKHDLYSLGIIGLEIFGNKRIRDQYIPYKLKKFTSKLVKNKKIKDVIIKLLSEDPEKRPYIDAVIKKLFNERVGLVLPVLPVFPFIDDFRKNSNYLEIRKIMKKTSREYSINWANRGFKALIHFLDNNDVKAEDKTVYTHCVLVILSSIFGINKFNYTTIQKKYNYKREQIIEVMDKLLNNKEFITILMLPTNSIMSSE